MNIIGEHIYLRAIEKSDNSILLDLMNNPEIEKNTGGWSFPISNENQMKWIEELKLDNSILRVMIVDKVENTPIGTAILSDIDYKNGTAEIHIKLVSEMTRKGYGFQTISLLSKYSFEELRLNCLISNINSNNTKSKLLFEKCGFVKEGLLKQRIYKNGVFQDVISYSLTKDDYIGNRK